MLSCVFPNCCHIFFYYILTCKNRGVYFITVASAVKISNEWARLSDFEDFDSDKIVGAILYVASFLLLYFNMYILSFQKLNAEWARLSDC